MPSAQGPKVAAFYKSSAWRMARSEVISLHHHLCQKCGRLGTEVHHIVPLTEENVSDPDIATNPDNLMLLCKSCHDAIRSEKSPGRCRFDDEGNVIDVTDDDSETLPPVPVSKKAHS